jgi:monoamine oxidase
MNRRDFIKKSFLTAASISISTGLSAARTIESPKRILITGAGLSGLIIAYELNKLGHEVTILEAQDRFGGRILTVREPFSENLYADAGAARIPVDHDLTRKYISEFKLPLIPFYPKIGKFVCWKNDRAEVAGWKKFAEETEAVMDLNKPEFWHKIEGGNDRLPAALAERLKEKIFLNSRVGRIVQNVDSVTVSFEQNGRLETVQGDFVVCTIPLTVLRKIEFSPVLQPVRQEIIQKTKYDAASRVFIETKRRFWEDDKLNGFGFGPDNAEIWNATFGQQGARGILQSYLRGEFAEKMTDLSPRLRLSKTIEELNKLFRHLPENAAAGYSKCWSEDPFSEGAWGHLLPREKEVFYQPDGRIFFAGEHLSDYGSWMQGAIISGLRVVEALGRIGHFGKLRSIVNSE